MKTLKPKVLKRGKRSRDHSQVNDLIDEGMISVEEAKNHPLSNVITRAVGVMDEVKVDVIEGEINKGDIFLLCSDGLTGELSDNSNNRETHQQDLLSFVTSVDQIKHQATRQQTN